MQNLAGLKSLYALHILHFRSDDTCIWVFRELRRFIVDNVSQHPSLPLEYLALKDSVSQLARRVKAPSTATATTKKKKSAQKDGEGAKDVVGTSPSAGTASTGGSGNVASAGESKSDNGVTDDVAAAAADNDNDDVDADDEEEDDDDDEVFLCNGLNIDTIDGYRFSDLPEIKIFSREIRLGKL